MKRSLLGGLAILLALWPAGAAHSLGENYVAPPFRQYYQQHDGLRILGPSLSGLRSVDGLAAQYFEKGRFEDHRAEVADPAWRLMYGRLTAELIEQAPAYPVNGTAMTYAELGGYARPEYRLAPPPGFTSGTAAVAGGVFIPCDPQLGAAPGYVVPAMFWAYLNRADLFPSGWLHDSGLPMTAVISLTALKNGAPREILLQAFERTVLTYDPLNRAEWQVERGNLGLDRLLAAGQQPWETSGRKWIEVSLGRQWLYAYEGDELIYDAPVSTGKDGFETPTGDFAIYAKVRLQTMTGSAGGETWVVPDVPNVMYIYGDIALHGTYWHNLFGTGVRMSHGCINLPLDAAALLYDWAPLGTPVWVHD
jgi:lipoprotein-anchoring transpeptidase ErfK/SrfK